MANERGRIPGPKEEKRVTVSVRLLPTVRDALEYAAKRDRRTLAGMAEIFIEDGLRARGLLKDEDLFS